MDERRETIADIAAEMRSLVKPGETLEHTYELLNGLAARIEAAHRRDIEAYDLIDFMSPVGRVKPAPVGNGAKMREALEQIRQKAIATIPGSSIQKRTLDKFRLLASAALAEPPRNCDRFNTLEDALAGWREVSPAESGPFDEWLFAEAKGETDAIK